MSCLPLSHFLSLFSWGLMMPKPWICPWQGKCMEPWDNWKPCLHGLPCWVNAECLPHILPPRPYCPPVLMLSSYLSCCPPDPVLLPPVLPYFSPVHSYQCFLILVSASDPCSTAVYGLGLMGWVICASSEWGLWDNTTLGIQMIWDWIWILA